MKLIFCNYHFRLFRDNGIINVLNKDITRTIKIEKHRLMTECDKEHCKDEGKYEIEY